MSLSALRMESIGLQADPREWRRANALSRQREQFETFCPRAARRLLVPRLREFNRSQPLFRDNSEDVLLLVFKYLVEDDAIRTAFSTFSSPHPRAAPLNLWGLTRHCALLVEERTEWWAAVSGMQHDYNSPHPELVKLWIKRAGEERPLDLHIAPPRWMYESEAVGGGRRVGMEGFEDEMTPRILRVFGEHVGRWRRIAFEFDEALAGVYLGMLRSIMGREGEEGRPGKVEHVEIVARKVEKTETVQELFRMSVGAFKGSAKKVLWGGPKGVAMSPAVEGERIEMPNVKVLALEVFDIEEVFGCLKSLGMPTLEELKVCFVEGGEAGVHGVRWREKVDELFEILGQLSCRPGVLWIHDDGLLLDREMVEMLVEKALRRDSECEFGTSVLALRADGLDAARVESYIGGKDHCVVSSFEDGSAHVTVATNGAGKR